ncbi:MAG TPA: ATP-binding protein [Ensifer sp.]|jgi:signal transduction histidine kinase|uniref:sensor histidine kinase n=1 Tax=Ensifer sp. TaxID=1872086 RepID=UPI002E0D1C67|nr:ATP-binding protein [Ensifer sp.]
MTLNSRPTLARPLYLVVVWWLLLLVGAGALGVWERQALVAELERESTALHSLASQRADQHDAHLTALSAVAVASEGRRHDLFLDVARTIIRFYPRIDEVQLVPLDPTAEVIGTASLNAGSAELVRTVARASDGRIALLAHPQRPDHYIMIKRSPNTAEARYGLMLGIDAAKLIGDGGPFWSRPGMAVRLSMPDGQSLLRPPALPEAIRFSKALGSASQPLLLETGMEIGLTDMFPPVRTGLTLLAISLAYLAALAALRQRARTRVAVEQATLSALESRLTHASRVNALGEMASGMAHELTQPLTAILAQAQAGRRLLAQGQYEALAPALDDNVAQARRASAILERFRNWSHPHAAPVAALDLRGALANVRALLEQEANSRGVEIEFRAPETPVTVVADPVEIEQVAFNLVRNALEALDGGARDRGRITVTLTDEGSTAAFEVSDNGPGIAPELRPRLFTPFTTTRAGGTGLGLALSQRLVERAGGDITLVETENGATFRVALPKRSQREETRR